MEDVRRLLAISIIKFLKTELESQRLGEEGTEALEVAVQCLETAYNTEGVTSNDDLLAIYRSAAPTAAGNLYPKLSEVNKEMAEGKKVEGNDYMREGKFHQAIASYTAAIDVDPNNAIYYSNRAAAYAKLNDNKMSIADCEKALKIDPTYSKAYGRMGLAYFNDEIYDKAIEAYENALKLDPANLPYKTQLDSAREKLNARNCSQPGAAPVPPNPLGGMDLSALLSNPAVMSMAQNFMANPQVQNMFTNMMGGGGAAPGSNPTDASQEGAASGDSASAGVGGFGSGIDFNSVLNATSTFAAQMQQNNPEVVENLRAQFQQGTTPNFHPPDENKSEPK